jgi:acylglycerol lipase
VPLGQEFQAAALRRVETHFDAANGRSLFRRAWLPARAERSLVLVHGFAEHSGRYEAVGSWLARHGCAVHAYDQQGHGLSEGPRGHVDRFDDLLDDLDRLLALVAREHPGMPRVLMGHSMGGLVVAKLACERAPQVDFVVTSGAALMVSPALAPFKIVVARGLRRLLPRLAMDAGIDPKGLSRDLEVVRRYIEDPLVDGRATASLAVGMIDAGRQVLAAAGRVRIPVLVLHGGDDPLCPPAGSERFFAALAPEVLAGSEIHIYPKLRHEILNEPEHEQVLDDLLRWIHSREARRSDEA